MRADINIDATTTTESFAQQIANLDVEVVAKIELGKQREILSAESAKIVTGLAFGERPCSIGFISHQGSGTNVRSFGLVLIRVPNTTSGFVRSAYHALQGNASEYYGTHVYDMTPQEVWWPSPT